MLVPDAEQAAATSREHGPRVISPASSSHPQRRPLTDERGHADRDQDIRDFDPEPGNVATRWLSREPGRVFLVHTNEVGRIGQENADLNDVFQRCASRFQDCLAVGERLSCLFLNRGAGEVSGDRIDPDQPGDVDMLPGFHRLAVQRGAGGVLSADGLADVRKLPHDSVAAQDGVRQEPLSASLNCRATGVVRELVCGLAVFCDSEDRQVSISRASARCAIGAWETPRGPPVGTDSPALRATRVLTGDREIRAAQSEQVLCRVARRR